MGFGISVVVSYVLAASTFHSYAFLGLRVLVSTYFTPSWLCTCLFLHAQGGFAIVFSLCLPLRLHHWYSFVSTIDTVNRFYLKSTIFWWCWCFPINTNHEKQTQGMVMLLVFFWSMFIIIMPWISLYCIVLRLQLFGFQQLGPLPPYLFSIPLCNVFLACFKTLK